MWLTCGGTDWRLLVVSYSVTSDAEQPGAVSAGFGWVPPPNAVDSSIIMSTTFVPTLIVFISVQFCSTEQLNECQNQIEIIYSFNFF